VACARAPRQRHGRPARRRPRGGGSRAVWPVEANELFVALPSAIDARLKAAGAGYYPWTSDGWAKHDAAATDATLVRLVTPFATTATEVDRFVTIVRG
jgi:threonine aldolase